MNKNDLIAEIAKKTGSTKRETAEMVAAYEEVICEAIANNENISLHGFLKFECQTRKGRLIKGFNNTTGTYIPDFKFVKVTAGNTLKNALKNGD